MCKKYFYVFYLISIISCNTEDGNLKKGTFKLYEKDVLIGYIYRLENYQVEDYHEEDAFFAKLNWKDNNTCYIKVLDKEENRLDSLLFLLKHKKISKYIYELEGIPVNSSVDYEYKATLIKESSKVTKFLDTLKVLNTRYGNGSD